MQQRAEQSGEDEFADHFDELVRDTVHPVLDGLASRLRARGHVAKVLSEPRGRDQRLRPRGASVTLVVRARGTADPDTMGRHPSSRGPWSRQLELTWEGAPYLRLVCNIPARVIDVWSFSGLDSRYTHEGMGPSPWRIEDVTSDVVTNTAVRLIGLALGRVQVSELRVETGLSKEDVVSFSAHFDPVPRGDEWSCWLEQFEQRVSGHSHMNTYTVTSPRDQLETAARELLAAVQETNAAYPESFPAWRKAYDERRAEERRQSPYAAEQAILDRILTERPNPDSSPPLRQIADSKGPPSPAPKRWAYERPQRSEPPSDLAQILEGYDEWTAQVRQKADKSGEDEFADRFDALIANTVLPVLEDLASRLREHGHEAEVLSEPRGLDQWLGPRGAAVALVFRPRGTADEQRLGLLRIRMSPRPVPEWSRYFMLTCNVADRSVRVECQGGRGRDEPWHLEEVTSDAVKKRAIRLIGEALAAPQL